MAFSNFSSEDEGAAPFSEINVTPLVDVMLVLLIVFMITAPLMLEGVSVSLPKAKGEAIKQTVKPVTVTVDKQGQVFLADQKITLEQLPALMKANPHIQGGQEVFIEADETVSYGVVAKVLSLIKAAGASSVSIVMHPFEAQ